MAGEGTNLVDGEARRMAREAQQKAEQAARDVAVAMKWQEGHHDHCAERYAGLTGAIEKLHGRISKGQGEQLLRDQARDQAQQDRDRRVMWSLVGGLGSVVLLLTLQLLTSYADRLKILEALGKAGGGS